MNTVCKHKTVMQCTGVAGPLPTVLGNGWWHAVEASHSRGVLKSQTVIPYFYIHPWLSAASHYDAFMLMQCNALVVMRFLDAITSWRERIDSVLLRGLFISTRNVRWIDRNKYHLCLYASSKRTHICKACYRACTNISAIASNKADLMKAWKYKANCQTSKQKLKRQITAVCSAQKSPKRTVKKQHNMRPLSNTSDVVGNGWVKM